MPIPSALLIPAERLINQVLDTDPDSREKLLPLQGKCLALQCNMFEIFIYITASGIILLQQQPDVVHTRLKTNLSSLIKLIDGEESAHDSQFEIQGQLALAQKLIDIAQQMDIDWAQVLAPLMGDTPAQFISKRMKNFIQWQQHFRQSSRVNLHTYLQNECDLIPTKQELQTFQQDIQHLRQRINMLSQRLSQL